LHFLQALQAGCIPVLLSPRWELPFSEVIDWTKAAIVADERLPFQVLAALQEMPPTRVLALRQQTQFLWDAYFSSVEKVIHTTLEIIQDRIFGASAHPSLLWNSPPGALLALPTFSTSPLDFPFYHLQRGSRPVGRFSALIWVGAPGQPPLKLIQAVAASKHCAQILVLWSSEKPPPPRWPKTTVPLTVLEGQRKVRSGGGWGSREGGLQPLHAGNPGGHTQGALLEPEPEPDLDFQSGLKLVRKSLLPRHSRISPGGLLAPCGCGRASWSGWWAV